MRKIVALLLSILGLFLWGCYSDDDYQFVQLRIQDSLSLENEKNYVVGDTIFFELNFSRYLDEDGFSNKLDVFETTGALSFHYPMVLEKFSPQANGDTQIIVANNLIVEEKGRLVDDFNTLSALLNEEQDLYESRIGIILAETGNFRFSFDFFTLYPESNGDRIGLSITHNFTSINVEDFEFEVTQ